MQFAVVLSICNVIFKEQTFSLKQLLILGTWYGFFKNIPLGLIRSTSA